MGVIARGASAHARGRERPPTQSKRLGGRNSNELLTQDRLRRAASHRYCGRLHAYFLERNIGDDDDLAHDVLLLLPMYKPRPLPLPLLRILLRIL